MKGARADAFALLGLPRAFALDPADLDRRHHALARECHPDRFVRAAPRDRREALARATAVNDAHRTLRDPRTRAEHLLRLAGVDVAAEERSACDPGLLEAQLELREALAAARAAGDAATVAAIAAAARARLAAVDAELATLLADAAGVAEVRHAAAAILVRARFDEALAAAAGTR
ncbi:MAG: Fe-S protein assembly co-chaperone HscB [Anaeromyxobacteraceae bacterium]